MYSLISIRIMLRSSSNRHSASVLASSVLPTPVGPRNKKLPIGRLGSAIPARERMMASATFSTASSCPMTRLCNMLSRFKSFSRSPSISLDTGIPVQRQMILAISSSVTRSFKRLVLPAPCFSASSSSFFSCGILPYFSSLALFRS